jgi:hypothetical protein
LELVLLSLLLASGTQFNLPCSRPKVLPLRLLPKLVVVLKQP